MLTGQDDLPGHQTPTTFDHVVDSDPSWMERYWYTGHRIPQGDVIFEIGLGLHVQHHPVPWLRLNVDSVPPPRAADRT